MKETTKTANDTYLFAERMLIVQDKSRKFVPLRYNKAQRHYLENRSSRDLILKARQLGFSTVIQAEMFRLYTTGAEAMITMADKQENTDKLRRMAERYYEKLPPNIPKPVRSVANASVTIYPDIGSEVQIATAGAQSSGRASSYTLVHGSEVAYWTNADWVITGALQAVPEHLPDTWVVFESTANGANGWFYKECKAAMRGESEWKLHFYAWWWDDKYRLPLYEGETLNYTDEESALVRKYDLSPEQIKWRRKKKRDLKDRFQQEYPETPKQAFLTSGGGVFILDEDIHIQVGFEVVRELHPQSVYVGGIDWGQEPDFTALSIFEVPLDGRPVREVYMNRWNRQAWHVMRASIVDELKHYRVEKIVAEANSMGTSQIEDLIHDIEAAHLETSVQGFYTGNKSKHNAVVNLKNGLDERGVRLLDVEFANEEMNDFQTRQTATNLWTYGHPLEEDAHDDCVDARLLANYAATQLWI
jgi:hypothetical protein